MRIKSVGSGHVNLRLDDVEVELIWSAYAKATSFTDSEDFTPQEEHRATTFKDAFEALLVATTLHR